MDDSDVFLLGTAGVMDAGYCITVSKELTARTSAAAKRSSDGRLVREVRLFAPSPHLALLCFLHHKNQKIRLPDDGWTINKRGDIFH